MTLLQMSYILEVDRCGSMNRAAQNLFLSQSALSAAIAAYLGLGLGIRDAIVHAQKFLNHCLRHGYAPGLGAGPPNHASWIAKRVDE